MRARADELKLSRISIDEIAGVPAGYSAKLLSLKPVKKLGVLSISTVLPALAIRLVAISDDELMQRLQARKTIRTRRESAVRADSALQITLSGRHMRRIQRLGGLLSRSKMSKRQASLLGRRAALARWSGKRKRQLAAVKQRSA
jgi:hypothetical protein